MYSVSNYIRALSLSPSEAEMRSSELQALVFE